MDEIEVRRVEPQDYGALRQFYEHIYEGRVRYKYPERWEWAFVANPFKQESVPSVYVAVANAKIVGHVAAIEAPVWIDECNEALGWSVDSYVLPEYRGTGIGSKLQAINREDHPLFASLAMTPANMHIKLTKIGASQGPTAVLRVRTLTLTNQVNPLKARFENHLLAYSVAGIGAMAELVARVVWWRPRFAFSSSGLTIKGPDQATFGREEDDLWLKARVRYRLAVDRTSLYLNWRYVEQPWTEYWCLRAYDHLGELLGISVYRCAKESSPNVGVITEMFDSAGDERILKVLLDRTENALRAMGASQVQVAASEAQLNAVARSRGYFPVERRPLIINLPDKFRSMNPETATMLTKGDQDWDQFPRARFFDYAVIFYRLLKCFQRTIKARMGLGS